MEYFHDGRDWFFRKRYGLFVHWGLYALGGYHEQEQFRRNIPRAEYEQYAKQFNPVKFDPYRWIAQAREAGMEYLVFTTKHQDGFCMWDTETTDYKVTNTPFGRDVLKELADACHAENFPLLLYFSVVDNHHPAYPNRGQWHEFAAPLEGDHPNRDVFLGYMRAQVRELCTKYGKIYGFFWDANHLDYYDEGINWMIRDLQPDAVINGRGFDSGDYNTPEREYNESDLNAARRFGTPTEACQSVGMHSWGYKTDEDFYSAKYLMQSIDRVMAMGGNYLLNIGPTPEGELDSRCLTRIAPVSKWLSKVGEAFYDAVPVSDAIDDRGIFLTCKGNDLYVHFYQDPMGDSVELVPLEMCPEEVTLLNNGQKIPCGRSQGTKYWAFPMEYLRVHDLPTDQMAGEVMVLKMHYRHLPRTVRELRDSWELHEPAPIRQKEDR